MNGQIVPFRVIKGGRTAARKAEAKAARAKRVDPLYEKIKKLRRMRPYAAELIEAAIEGLINKPRQRARR